MTAMELIACVCDEPIVPHGQHARVYSQQTRLERGRWGVERIVYLPKIALVVVTYQDKTANLVPIDHVWHMTPDPRLDVFERIAEALA